MPSFPRKNPQQYTPPRKKPAFLDEKSGLVHETGDIAHLFREINQVAEAPVGATFGT